MKPLLSAVDAVLFDLDGTLVDTNIDFSLMKRRMLELADECGMDTGPLAGLDILAVIGSAVDFLRSRGQHQSGAELYARAMRILEDIELDHARNTKEIPFARELVAYLKSQDIATGIVTRNCRNASRMSLELAGITTDVLICREDCERHKPHPDPVLMAVEVLSVRQEHSIMVGDHMMDIASGKAAGLKTIGFLRDYRPEGFFDDVAPDRVARDLREVLGAIIDSDR